MHHPLQRTDQSKSCWQWSLDHQTWQKSSNQSQKINFTFDTPLCERCSHEGQLHQQLTCDHTQCMDKCKAGTWGLGIKYLSHKSFKSKSKYHTQQQNSLLANALVCLLFFVLDLDPAAISAKLAWYWHESDRFLGKQVPYVDVNFSTHWTRLHFYPGDQRSIQSRQL